MEVELELSAGKEISQLSFCIDRNSFSFVPGKFKVNRVAPSSEKSTPHAA